MRISQKYKRYVLLIFYLIFLPFIREYFFVGTSLKELENRVVNVYLLLRERYMHLIQAHENTVQFYLRKIRYYYAESFMCSVCGILCAILYK